MAERKAVNKYYPPDWTPDKGSLNTYMGQHPLRERAKNLHLGILVIRFEMPYDIWCDGCKNHIGKGVRYNAQKKQFGKYFSTKIWQFRMKCHLCDNWIEIHTDPQNTDYKVVSGAQRKYEEYTSAANETIELTSKDDKKKLEADPMYKLEHLGEDTRKAKEQAPQLNRLQDLMESRRDDYVLNSAARGSFRTEKKRVAAEKAAQEKEMAEKGLSYPLLPKSAQDTETALAVRFRTEKTDFELHHQSKRSRIKAGSIFGESSNKKLEKAREAKRTLMQNLRSLPQAQQQPPPTHKKKKFSSLSPSPSPSPSGAQQTEYLQAIRIAKKPRLVY
eukprot:gnl/Hemi2/1735_TR615_c0_g1_i1.p1 gnl/Hemi2/1735_TR615_c0_g1~~gnl/Hemi2/1735_TR615_c0_g1_i1.p1  ORF type:complete len:331 (-),score=82.05 gnl/Hemi2/1735_TR615_c0_g1_i1:294-1286(-)